MHYERSSKKIQKKPPKSRNRQRSDAEDWTESKGKMLQMKKEPLLVRHNTLLKHIVEGKKTGTSRFIISSMVQPPQDLFPCRRIGFQLAAECPCGAKRMQAQSFASFRLFCDRLTILVYLLLGAMKASIRRIPLPNLFAQREYFCR